MPIHVGGTPWMALFTLSPVGDARWLHNFLVYTALLPLISDRVRQETSGLYAELVAKRLGDLVATPGRAPRIEEVNTGLVRLCQVFPLPLVQLERPDTPHPQLDAQGNDLLVDRGADGDLILRTFENPYFEAQVPEGRANIKRIHAACIAEIERQHALFIESSAAAHERFLANVDAQEHKIFNRVAPLRNLEALSKDPDLPDDKRVAIADANRAISTIMTSLRIVLERDPEILPGDLRSLVDWLMAQTLSAEGPVTLTSDDDANLVFVLQQQRRDAYTVLWNVWHNAVKNGPTCVRVNRYGAGAQISVTNLGVMPDAWRLFALGEGPSPSTQGAGLKDIQTLAQNQGWHLAIDVDQVHSTTTVTITFQ